MPKDLATLAAKFRNAERIVLYSGKSERFADKPADKGVVRDYGRIRIKNQSSQFVANSSVHTMHGQVIKDVPENDESPRDPAWKAGQAKFATVRPNSPFKRAGKSAASVVIVRK